MLRIQCVFVLLICSAVHAQNPNHAFDGNMQITGSEPNVLDGGVFYSFLQERPLHPGDTLQFTEKIKVIPDKNGDFSLTDLVIHGSRLQPFSRLWPCTRQVPEERWIACFIGNAGNIPRDLTFHNMPLPTSATYDPIEGVVTGIFTMPEGGAYWAFQLNGIVNGQLIATNQYYVLPATINIPEPSGLAIMMLGLVMVVRLPNSPRLAG